MAGGGFGGGPFGGGPWGGAAPSGAGAQTADVADTITRTDGLTIQQTGSVTVSETIVLSESATGTVPFGVLSAIALSPFQVRVFFSETIDQGYAPNFDPSNYTIAGITVTAVAEAPTPDSLVLTTSEQGPFVYTVVVSSNVKADSGGFIGAANSAIFAGWPIQPTFFATGQSRTRVQLTFSTAMVQNTEYTDPASYTITDMNQTVLPITAATAVGPSPNRRLALDLGVELVPGGYYVATIVDPAVIAVNTLPVVPDADLFQWNEAPRPIGSQPIFIRISDFTGEVSGGILGQPAGQVFFSPSLEAPAPNSSIQVDEISVCTRAFDVYTPPGPIDPEPLYTFGGAVSSTLGNSVLWAPFDRLLGAQINLEDHPADTLGPYTDGPATATLEEPLDITYLSLLNNSFWTLFDGVGTPFITANNLAPIPPGPPPTVIVLQP